MPPALQPKTPAPRTVAAHIPSIQHSTNPSAQDRDHAQFLVTETLTALDELRQIPNLKSLRGKKRAHVQDLFDFIHFGLSELRTLYPAAGTQER
ncbi:MAG: hypothetical protein IT585_10905 [candidate division Zixibacteria bacterium]|nr:hypothetical protein [candidate division Zixibacteria bacterium]